MTNKIVVIVLLALPVSASNAAEEVRMPLVALSGANSQVRTASYRRVTSPKEWGQIWASHLGTSVDDAYRQHFEVDFERCMVMAIFRGEQRNSRGIQIDSTEDNEESILVRFTQLGYQTAGESNYKPLDRPYAFIIVPATAKTIIFEENVQNLKGYPPEWKEIARLNGRELHPGSP